MTRSLLCLYSNLRCRHFYIILIFFETGFPGSTVFLGFSSDSDGKESTCHVGDLGSIPGFSSWVGKIPWRREQLPTPVFLPGEFHGQRSLASTLMLGKIEGRRRRGRQRARGLDGITDSMAMSLSNSGRW